MVGGARSTASASRSTTCWPGRYGFGASEILSREETLERLPTIKTEGLRGGVVYYDGQFDDARLLINLVATAAEQGATLLNYAPVTALTRDADGFVDGVVARDLESGRELRAEAKVVINAAGPFCDAVRRLAEPGVGAADRAQPGDPSRVRRLLPARGHAIMVPHTSDGRVMFAIPWHGHTVVGTTDTPIEEATLEPRPLEEEIEFMLETAGRYLRKPITRARRAQRLRRASGRSCGRATRRTPRPSRATTRSTSTPRACSPSPAASGPPTGTWPRTA